MYLYVTRTFEDLACGVIRSAGTVLEVTEERASTIISAGFATPVQVICAIPEDSEEPEVKANDNKGKGTGSKATSK